MPRVEQRSPTAPDLRREAPILKARLYHLFPGQAMPGAEEAWRLGPEDFAEGFDQGP